MAQRHSTPIRGLMSTKHSPLFQGRFGRLFRSLPAARFGASDAESVKNLALLGDKMSAGFDPPTDGKDPEESGIPALYTYFGQFIDHDLTFDPASSLQKQDDPDALTDFRTPAFDLDNIYGRGPDDQPYMYDSDGKSFLLGNPLTGGDPRATDLPRNSAARARALIGDPRNDENTIVSQLQGLFHRFHNRTVKDHPTLSFEQIQKRVRFHYQYVILHDFLPRIVQAEVLNDLKTHGRFEKGNLKFFHWKDEPFMPVEFSVACYRFGHSMIRPGYRLNDDDSTLLPIFTTDDAVKAGFKDDLQGFRAVVPNRAIDWGRFIDIDNRVYDGTDAQNKKRLQFAYRIDTSLVDPLSNLPAVVAANPSSLAQRNLERSFRLGLPSAQQVAHAMGVKPMDDKDILIGKGVDKQDPSDPPIISIDQVSPVFKDNCPLWTYILAEALKNQIKVQIPVKEKITITTPQLGPVGGRIVAKVFLGLMFGDNHSLLSMQPGWQPEHTPYALKDFVNYALGN
ncbi:MAG TPA: heme peroxidase family protein [Candidatus Solibacter sp.]|nr:heme peroxidase family protein [Candidatus Solibacter sp.]